MNLSVYFVVIMLKLSYVMIGSMGLQISITSYNYRCHKPIIHRISTIFIITVICLATGLVVRMSRKHMHVSCIDGMGTVDRRGYGGRQKALF